MKRGAARFPAVALCLGAVLFIGACPCCGGKITGAHPELPVASVKVSLSASSVRVGGTITSNAALFDSTGSATTGTSGYVTWSSSNRSVATVVGGGGNFGVITGVSPGTAFMIARIGTYSDSAAVTVTASSAAQR